MKKSVKNEAKTKIPKVRNVLTETQLKKASTPKEPKSKDLLDPAKVSSFVDALFKVQKSRSGKTEGKKERLFEDLESERINLMISSIKIPSDKRQHILKIQLPHSIHPESKDVCLIVKDLQKGLKVDHEPTAVHFKDLLAEKGVGPELVSAVMPLRELKVEHRSFETKIALSQAYDVFLADDCIYRFLPTLLGRPFYRKKKFPIAVDLKAKDLPAEIKSALNCTTLPLSNQGVSSMVQVGHMGMKQEQIVENLLEVVKTLEKRFPGGWINIRSLHIKSETSISIPIHVSTVSINDVGFVDSTVPKRKMREAVTDELSTRPGLEVTVRPDGKVDVKKKPDPNWDLAKGEPLSEESDADEIDSEDSDNDGGEEKNKKKIEKKETKKRPKKETAKQNGGKAKKQKKAESEEDSEDEDMQKSEQTYLHKQAAVATDEAEADKDKPEATKGKKNKKKDQVVAQEPAKPKEKAVKADEKVGKKKAKEPPKVEEVPSKSSKTKVAKDEKSKTPAKKGKEVKVEAKTKPLKKEEIADSSDSEDEEMDEAEMKYLKKHEPVDEVEGEAGSSDEESDDVYDDEQELDAKNIIMDQDDDDSDGEEGSDDEQLILKNPPQYNDESGDDDEGPAKPKRVKKSKKERRLDAKRQKAEGVGKQSKKKGKK